MVCINTDKWAQTDFSELYSILPDVIKVLKEMQRYDDLEQLWNASEKEYLQKT
jgi:hypothetical protein